MNWHALETNFPMTSHSKGSMAILPFFAAHGFTTVLFVEEENIILTKIPAVFLF
jgi:hypothetical protein